jgi:hypothetical protein
LLHITISIIFYFVTNKLVLEKFIDRWVKKR